MESMSSAPQGANLPCEAGDQFTLTPFREVQISSVVSGCRATDQYKITYPAAVITALGELYREYNAAFASLVAANSEADSDYAPCMAGIGGTPVTCAVQIDMMGLTPEFLEAAAEMDPDELREALRGMIFEIENSLAAYQLLENVFVIDGQQSYFQVRFRRMLEQIRRRHGRSIALLAVTTAKRDEMLAAEFGRAPGEMPSEVEVRRLSGFDAFFGPEEFRQYIADNGGACDHLLYVRSSEPLEKLRNPDRVEVEHPLLEDEGMRRIIKANSLTMNVDTPNSDQGTWINDTKRYMAPMGMAFEVREDTDLLSVELNTHLMDRGSLDTFTGADLLASGFVRYLRMRGVPEDQIQQAAVTLRAKPALAAYGCYGHVSGAPTYGRFRMKLRRGLRDRGLYVVQPEMENPTFRDEVTGTVYAYIDRNFMEFTGDGPVFMGGFRTLMPVDSAEAKKGRLHGNAETVWAEIRS